MLMKAMFSNFIWVREEAGYLNSYYVTREMSLAHIPYL